MRHLRLVGVVVFALVASACGPSGEPIGGDVPGRLQGENSRFGSDDDTTSGACFLALDAEQAARLWALAGQEAVVPEEFRAPAVGVFMGPRPTGGYAVALTSRTTDDAGVTLLSAQVRRPASGDSVTAAETSPFLLLPIAPVAGEVRIVGDIELTCVDHVPQVRDRSVHLDGEGEGGG